MARTERLLDLLQILRRHRFPISGAQLAQELNISLRTLYRDIATLQAQGAEIEGEPGLGYILRPGFLLPPLMFSEQEIEALVLGARWVADRADSQLQTAAKNALAKISSVLPQELRLQLDTSGLLVGPGEMAENNDADLILIRNAVRKEHKVQLSYKDMHDRVSQRIIWPLGVGYFDKVRIVISWCELRQDFRHFRVDRIVEVINLQQRYTQSRLSLLKQWRTLHNIPDPTDKN